MHERLSQELKDNRQKYARQIKALQQKVAQETELSVVIQSQEQRNKKLVEDFFAGQKAQIGKNRKTSKAAYGYYKNMSGGNYVQPQFFDDKQ